MTATTPRLLRRTISALGLGLFIALGAVMVLYDDLPNDFFYYTASVRTLHAGGSAYLPFQIGPSFLYHPAILTVMTWLAALDDQTAYLVWLGLSFLAYGLTLAVLLRFANKHLLADGRRLGVLEQVILAGAFLAFRPTLQTFIQGQINLFVLLALALALLWSEDGREAWAGIALGLAVAAKVSPVVLLAYFLVTRAWRVILWSAVTVIVLSALAWLQFGSGVFADFITASLFVMGGIHEWRSNHSLPMWLLTFFRNLSLEDAAYTLASWLPRLLYWGVSGLAVLVGLLRADRLRESALARYWLYALLVAQMTLASPLVWNHHLVFLVLPLVFLLARQETRAIGLGLTALFQLEPVLGWLLGAAWIPGTALVAAQVLLFLALAWLFWRAVRAAPAALTATADAH
ncbi:MAG: DUF2029 domain-containing protein [Anaerolineae bacterium]|nr:DUF2029 domain-containing protein [Anaerolineae bacterium]